MAVLALLHSELSRREGNDDRARRGYWRCVLPAFGLVLSLSGCAAFRSYDTELYQTLDEASAGNVDNAVGILESNNRGASKDLLYYLELGMLQRLGDRYVESQKSWMSANERVQTWERTAQTDPEKLLPGAASYLINERLRPYEGHDYEKVMLLTYNALKNSYQSALSHYLAGFVYEALGEPSLAAPGYRLANELQPNRPLLEEALRGLDQRVSARYDGLTDVLFVIGSGTAPALRSRQFRLLVLAKDKPILIPISFPVMVATSTPYLPVQLKLNDGQSLPVTPITSIDLMARRGLQDDMPGIMLRATIRSTAKAVVPYPLQKQAQHQDKNSAVFGLAALAVTIGSAATELADERTWRTLPSEIAIARARLPAGTHTVTLQTPESLRSVRLNVSGRYAVIDFRLLRRQVFVQPREATVSGGGRQPADDGAAPAPSTGGGPGTLKQQPQTMETPK